MCKWITEPERFTPEHKTIIDCIKWHLAIKNKYSTLFQELNSDTYDEDGVACLGDLKTTSEIMFLICRDKEYISRLGYINVARIEAAMMYGRELWYKNRNGYTDYDEELSKIEISDLTRWMKVFHIPPTIEEGGNVERAVEYTLAKRGEFLQLYVDAYEKYRESEQA